MVAESDLGPIVESIGRSYPSFAKWYDNLTDTQKKGMRDAWLRQLSSLEPSDVRVAADEILDGRVEMPKNYEFDRLGNLLRTWGGVEAARRIEQRNTEQLRDQAKPPADSSLKSMSWRFGPSIKCAAAWGSALRAGHVSEAENATAMEVIHRYHKQGNVELCWPTVPQTDQKSMVDFWK
ncbi:hypothetical protein [Planctomycetes bacterium TBK1r]|uniref:Uncharacterized protein n=1 Tax=Stieleria magnilauensis TaxID=2527963 RepID=A0ABX5XYF9_9BACT|nr:hypothetical protein TBK1r_59830 [Planctomycetes bacterium TBK1r]QDV87034.1 hypothetical protein TBK1r_60610 [Planctomycetes bacterium TBK1r]